MNGVPIPKPSELENALGQVSRVQFIAKGGFKAVFRGIVQGEQEEAIKAIYLPGQAEGIDEDVRIQLLARAKREIQALGLCRSPWLVQLGTLKSQLVQIGNHEYLVYSEELLSGHPLSDLIGTGVRPDLDSLVQVSNCLLGVIKEMIRIGFLHRDIKPDNIMVTGDRARPYVVLDMGIAYKMHGTQLTQGANPPGTVRYMAPELLSPDYKDMMDFRCDLYAVGLSIYEYASGIQPFAPRPESPYATMYRIMHERPSRLETLRDDLPIRFCRMIDRCIKKRPALRYARVDLLENELQEILR